MANRFSDSVAGESHFVLLGGNRIHYVSLGQANRTIVFIHGWACNLGFWREQVSALREKARLILVDLPGHGESDKPRVDYTMDFFTDAVLAVLSDAEVDEAVFICHSMGAAVLSRLHGRAPEKIAGLIAVDGLLRRPSGTRRQMEEFLTPFGTGGYLDHAGKIINSFFPMPGTEEIRDRVKAEMLATPQHVMSSAMQTIFQPHNDWILREITVPFLVINASNSLWPAINGRDLRAFAPQSDFLAVDGTGHFLMLEKPKEFNAALAGMLAKFDLLR